MDIPSVADDPKFHLQEFKLLVVRFIQSLLFAAGYRQTHEYARV